jgi:hypothetical protein
MWMQIAVNNREFGTPRPREVRPAPAGQLESADLRQLAVSVDQLLLRAPDAAARTGTPS